MVDATSCNGTCGVFVRLSSQLGWIATEFSERLRICCSGPQPDRHRVENILELFAKAGRRLHNHIEHWTRNREASNVPSNPLAGELRARGSMGNARLSTRVGPQGFRVTRSFVPLGRFMLLRCPEPRVQAATEERFEIEDIWRRHLIQQKAGKVVQRRCWMGWSVPYYDVFTCIY